MVFMRTIDGFLFVVSDEFADKVRTRKWRRMKSEHTCYVMATDNREERRLARWLLGAKPGEWVDHVNHRGMDNRMENIRLVSPSQNSMNRVKKPWKKGMETASGLKGVHRRQEHETWRAVICVDGKRTNLGDYDNEVDAGLAYDRAAKEAHGHAALTNGLPDDGHVLSRHKHSVRSKLLGSVSRHKSGKLQAFLKREYLGLFETEAEAREAIRKKKKKETEDEHEDTNV